MLHVVEGATGDVREGDITEVSIEDDEKNPLNVFFWSTSTSESG